MKRFLTLLLFLALSVASLEARAQAPVGGFIATGSTNHGVTGATSNFALPTNYLTGAYNAIVTNTGAADVWIALGPDNTVTATVADFLVPAGQWRGIGIGQQKYMAVISGGAASVIYVSTGKGTPIGGGSGGTASFSGDVNVSQISGLAVPLGAGPAAAALRIAFPNDQNITAIFAGNSVWTELVPANTTGILIGAAGPHQVLSFSGFTKSTTEIEYVRIYDVGVAPTCSSATGIVWHGMIPAPALGGGGLSPSFPEGGFAVTNGIGICISAGYGDTDTTSPTVSVAMANVIYR